MTKTNRVVRLRLATWNAGPGHVKDLLAILEILGPTGILAGQEWSDRHHDLTPAAIAAGWRVIVGHQPGQEATPLLLGPEVALSKRSIRVLLRKMFIGPGAGPDHNKQKSAVGGKCRIDGLRIGALSTHLVASQQNAPRLHAALLYVEKWIDWLNPAPLPWFVMGDCNATLDSPVAHRLYKAGWTNSHRESGNPLPTHGHRVIDYVWWRKNKRVRFVDHETIETTSDHRALVVIVDVVRHRWAA